MKPARWMVTGSIVLLCTLLLLIYPVRKDGQNKPVHLTGKPVTGEGDIFIPVTSYEVNIPR